ncbi:bacteriocin immunity protein [Paenibacillus algorifonticola]|uniref:bacteriocin immunity protein n=1 Tax=Paenibacillus algorifonticola TaxID=684063 RepID=UPI003D2C5309
MDSKLSKKELVELVELICNPELSDKEIGEYIDLLEKNVPHPAPSDLIFWSEEDLSPEQVVEIALAYKEELG